MARPYWSTSWTNTHPVFLSGAVTFHHQSFDFDLPLLKLLPNRCEESSSIKMFNLNWVEHRVTGEYNLKIKREEKEQMERKWGKNEEKGKKEVKKLVRKLVLKFRLPHTLEICYREENSAKTFFLGGERNQSLVRIYSPVELWINNVYICREFFFSFISYYPLGPVVHRNRFMFVKR